jgi:hypothetical protein
LPDEVDKVGCYLDKDSAFPMFVYDIARPETWENHTLNRLSINIMQGQYQVWGLNKQSEKTLYLGEVEIKVMKDWDYAIEMPLRTKGSLP